MGVPIKSIGGNPIVPDQISGGATEGNYALLTAGAADGLKGGGPTVDAAFLHRITGGRQASDGPATIEVIRGNTILQDSELVSVQMEGIKSFGFNQWDEEWELGTFDSDGQPMANTSSIRSKNYIHVFPNTTYYYKSPILSGGGYVALNPNMYDADKTYIGRYGSYIYNTTFTTPSNCHYLKIGFPATYGTTYKHDTCINFSDPARNGQYEPYRGQTRSIDVASYFPDGMRGAGTAADLLYKDRAETHIGVVDLGSLTWTHGESSSLGEFLYANVGTYHFAPTNSDITIPITYTAAYITSDGNYLRIVGTGYTDPAAFKTAMNGVYAFIALATPTVTPIDPPLNLSYRAEQGGTETVLVPTGEQSAPVPMVVVYGSTPDGILDRSASLLAAQDGPTATANHAIGSYLTMGGQLYRVTTAIASGEAIVPGTNVTATTVMAEVLSLIQ